VNWFWGDLRKGGRVNRAKGLTSSLELRFSFPNFYIFLTTPLPTRVEGFNQFDIPRVLIPSPSSQVDP
jgi:hypothetical protein